MDVNIFSSKHAQRKSALPFSVWLERRAQRLGQLHGLPLDEALRQVVEAHGWRPHVPDRVEETDR